MPELRKDPIIERWVIISDERGKRPLDLVSPASGRKEPDYCIFCPGNELTSPNEILAFRNPDSDGTAEWTLRVVPNKFPALQSTGETGEVTEGMLTMMNGIGTHEVIIETRDHTLSLSTMNTKSAEDVLWAYYSRLKDLKKDNRFKYIHIFKNEGKDAGASLEHTHSQLIALPIVPKRVQEELDASLEYYNSNKECIFCNLISRERELQKRVIVENDDYIALSPYAPRAPFETWILPKQHQSSFQPYNTNFSGLAEMLQTILQRLDRHLEIPPYNYLIHTSPFSKEENEYYHWHIEILPKLSRRAGFEWGSGFYINPTSPEEATKLMCQL